MSRRPRDGERETQLAYFSRLAHDAWERGQRASAEGDHATARLWLERARRLAPEDGMVAFSLAMLLLARNDPGAAPLFEALARTLDRREAWLGLAAIRFGQRQHAAAAEAAAAALSRHTPSSAMEALLDRVAAAARAPGWCGLDGEGVLTIRGCRRPGAVRVALDGLPVTLPPDHRLPPSWAEAARISVRLGGRPLLGSPLQPAAIRRVEGFVAAVDGALEGWAWHPGDPDRDPVLTLRDASGRTRVTVAEDREMDLTRHKPLAQPRRFRIEPAALAGLAAPLVLTGSDGSRLLGSPLDPAAEAKGAVALARTVAAKFPAGEASPPRWWSRPACAPRCADRREPPRPARAQPRW